MKLNPLLFFVFIEETIRESKKRKNKTSPEKDEGALIALNVRANKYDQSISQDWGLIVFSFFIVEPPPEKQERKKAKKQKTKGTLL